MIHDSIRRSSNINALVQVLNSWSANVPSSTKLRYISRNYDCTLCDGMTSQIVVDSVWDRLAPTPCQISIARESRWAQAIYEQTDVNGYSYFTSSKACNPIAIDLVAHRPTIEKGNLDGPIQTANPSVTQLLPLLLRIPIIQLWLLQLQRPSRPSIIAINNLARLFSKATAVMIEFCVLVLKRE
jgi:hypothetical protein